MVSFVKKYEATNALAFILLPLILILSNGSIEPSISDYVYTDSKLLFVFLLTFSGTLFWRNGIRNLDTKWYNLILGTSLFVVSLTPYKENTFLHFFSAGVFFLGSVFVMIYFSNKKQLIHMVLLGSLIVFGLLGHFLFHWYSLFWAEWIGILPISIHFAGEALNKIE